LHKLVKNSSIAVAAFLNKQALKTFELRFDAFYAYLLARRIG